MLFRCDVYEEDGELVVEIEAPGVPPEKLGVWIEDGAVHVEAALERGGARRSWHRRERPGGAFRREIPLPAPVLPALADALVRDGLLRIRLPLAKRRAAERIELGFEREQVLATHG